MCGGCASIPQVQSKDLVTMAYSRDNHSACQSAIGEVHEQEGTASSQRRKCAGGSQ